MMNVREDYPEPYVENKVAFRDTGSVMQHKVPTVLTSASKQRRNLSQARTTAAAHHSAFKGTPSQ
jgi:hypothetical protein